MGWQDSSRATLSAGLCIYTGAGSVPLAADKPHLTELQPGCCPGTSTGPGSPVGALCCGYWRQDTCPLLWLCKNTPWWLLGTRFTPFCKPRCGSRVPALGTGRTWWYVAPTTMSDASPPQPCHMPVPPLVAAACPQGHTETPIPIASQKGGESFPAPTDANAR